MTQIVSCYLSDAMYWMELPQPRYNQDNVLLDKKVVTETRAPVTIGHIEDALFYPKICTVQSRYLLFGTALKIRSGASIKKLQHRRLHIRQRC